MGDSLEFLRQHHAVEDSVDPLPPVLRHRHLPIATAGPAISGVPRRFAPHRPKIDFLDHDGLGQQGKHEGFHDDGKPPFRHAAPSGLVRRGERRTLGAGWTYSVLLGRSRSEDASRGATFEGAFFKSRSRDHGVCTTPFGKGRRTETQEPHRRDFRLGWEAGSPSL